MSYTNTQLIFFFYFYFILGFEKTANIVMMFWNGVVLEIPYLVT